MSKFYLILAFLNVPASHFSAMENATPARHQSEEGISWQADKFGNICPSITDVANSYMGFPTRRVQNLRNFVTNMSTRFPGKAILMRIPHGGTFASYIVDVKDAGFKFRHGNDESTEWIVHNGSPIPAATTAIAGARVIILKEGKALVIEDKNLKGRLMFPGGSVDPQELALDTACREVKEEVGLTIERNNLKLIALVNRVRANEQGSSDYCHYYVATQAKGAVVPQESEISRAEWISIDDIAIQDEINGLKSSKITKAIALHVFNALHGASSVGTFPIVDYRQMFKPEDTRDKKDLMTLDLFAQDFSKS